MKKYGFGVDIGGTTCKIGLFETSGKMLDKWEIPTNKADNGGHILDDVAASIDEKMKSASIAKEDVEGIGVGVPGPVLEDGSVSVCVNLGWGQVQVADELSSKTGLPVKVYRHHGRRDERRQVHHQRIHRHHAVQVGDEVHLPGETDLAVQGRDVGIRAFHLLGERLFGASASVDENPPVTLREHPHEFAALLLGIGLAPVCGEGCEAHPHAVFLPEGIGAVPAHGGRRVVQHESQLPENVAVAQHRVAQRLHRILPK